MWGLIVNILSPQIQKSPNLKMFNPQMRNNLRTLKIRKSKFKNKILLKSKKFKGNHKRIKGRFKSQSPIYKLTH